MRGGVVLLAGAGVVTLVVVGRHANAKAVREKTFFMVVVRNL